MAVKTIEEVLGTVKSLGEFYNLIYVEQVEQGSTDIGYQNRMLGRATQCREIVNYILGMREYDDGE